MNRKTFVIFLLMAAMAMFGLSSCFSIKVVDYTHNARNSLDWAGVYTGTIPWVSERINVSLRLNLDQSFEFEYYYLDRPDEPINRHPGSFRWDDTGNIIIIEMIDTVTHYKVAENMLIRLDEIGLAYNYVLKKNSDHTMITKPLYWRSRHNLRALQFIFKNAYLRSKFMDYYFVPVKGIRVIFRSFVSYDRFHRSDLPPFCVLDVGL
jgi:hypothetical protein